MVVSYGKHMAVLGRKLTEGSGKYMEGEIVLFPRN